MSAPIAAQLSALREEYRRPGEGYRELFVDGEAYGWLPPGWTVPEHRCITVRAPLSIRCETGIMRAYVETDDSETVYARTWTEQDDANFRARSQA